MPRMPLDPLIQPTIELCRQPKAVLIRDEDWNCPACDESYALDIEGKERECVTCTIKQSGKSSILLFGWKVQKASGQLIAQPPEHRVDGK